MGGGLFITGTDTGVGKTFVACALAALLKYMGYRVGVMKPAETGCMEREGKLIATDAVRLKQASGCEFPLEKICPYQFREPLAPVIAAEREGARIDIDRLIEIYGEIGSRHDITLVEGAGGLLAPLLPSYTYADLAWVLRLPMLVIGANRLGVLNHLLLTLEHASYKGLAVLGYVLNQMESQSSPAAETNREALSSLTGVPCAGEFPYFENLRADELPPVDSLKELFELALLEPVLRVG